MSKSAALKAVAAAFNASRGRTKLYRWLMANFDELPPYQKHRVNWRALTDALNAIPVNDGPGEPPLTVKAVSQTYARVAQARAAVAEPKPSAAPAAPVAIPAASPTAPASVERPRPTKKRYDFKPITLLKDSLTDE